MKYLRLSLMGTNLPAWIQKNGFSRVTTFAQRLSLIPKVILLTEKVSDSSQEKMIESERMVLVHMFLGVLNK